MQERLEQALHTSQCLQKDKAGIEHEHSNLQELHKQLMTELQQRTEGVPQVGCLMSGTAVECIKGHMTDCFAHAKHVAALSRETYSFPLDGTAKSCDLTAFGIVYFVTVRIA